MKYETSGHYTVKIKAEDGCGNKTVVERSVTVKAPETFSTVLYHDGLLIINESSNDRTHNIHAHGGVWHEYPTAPYNGFAAQTDIPWYDQRRDVLKVKFGSRVTETSLQRYFSMLFYVQEIDLTNLDTSTCTTFERAFSSCNRLENIIGIDAIDTSHVLSYYMMYYSNFNIKTLDLSAFNTIAANNTSQMFDACSSLHTIYASDLFNVSNVTMSNNMFRDCNNLVGAISYNPSRTDKTYANFGGYFTRK